jgi:hypothetical protein
LGEAVNLKDIFDDFSESQGENAPLYRNRPYKGQSHTDYGERGKQLISGLTMRDIVDAFIMGAMAAGNDQIKNYLEREKLRLFTWNDLYKLDWSKIDPGAVSQNMTCEIEKMMGIFPNIPKIKSKEKL